MYDYRSNNWRCEDITLVCNHVFVRGMNGICLFRMTSARKEFGTVGRIFINAPSIVCSILGFSVVVVLNGSSDARSVDNSVTENGVVGAAGVKMRVVELDEDARAGTLGWRFHLFSKLEDSSSEGMDLVADWVRAILGIKVWVMGSLVLWREYRLMIFTAGSRLVASGSLWWMSYRLLWSPWPSTKLWRLSWVNPKCWSSSFSSSVLLSVNTRSFLFSNFSSIYCDWCMGTIIVLPPRNFPFEGLLLSRFGIVRIDPEKKLWYRIDGMEDMLLTKPVASNWFKRLPWSGSNTVWSNLI